MTASFQEFKDRAAEWWPDAFVAEGDDVFALALNGFALRFAALPGDPAATLVRARVLDLADVPRAADFAKAALAGNFFWGGTRGATLSVGADGALYATERRPLDELEDVKSLEACVTDFARTAADWRERSALYA
jgi:hypothetical protein